MAQWEQLELFEGLSGSKYCGALYLVLTKFWEGAALYAGLQYATGDLVVMMDADSGPPGMLPR